MNHMTPHTLTVANNNYQDPTTKCTDPADKDAVIRDLRIKLNDKQGVIDSIRGDVEAAHRHIEMHKRRIEKWGVPHHIQHAQRALENIIESMGVNP